MRPLLATALLLPCLLAPRAAADVLIVDWTGAGGAFLELQPAVNAADDGDTILVRPGDYVFGLSSIDVNGKSLVIVGDTGGVVELAAMRVRNLAAAQSVVLRNLTLRPWLSAAWSAPIPSLFLEDNDGVVHVEDCTLIGRPGLGGALGGSAEPGLPAARADDSAGLSFQRCTLIGGSGTDTDLLPHGQLVTSDGGPGLLVLGSHVAVYGSTVTGGRGGHDVTQIHAGGRGGDGIEGTSGAVVLSGSSVAGGAGGDGCTARTALDGCQGGTGVRLAGPAAKLQDLDVAITGGAGGTLDGGGSGGAGQDVLLNGGAHTSHTGEAVHLEIAGPLRTGETGSITITGPPNRLFALFYGFAPGHLPLLHFKGVFLVGLPLHGPVLIDVIPPSGTLTAPYVAPSIAPFGLEALLTIDQLIVDQGADGLIVSGASTHVQVDAGF